ncbi:unnamed protein product [Lupinus luteus]|uniref:Transposase-associated domain-containing protein n=1 Tax=Lupinus luteus TaxID=3873 RepID=A0AAV1WGE3_LUPLU
MDKEWIKLPRYSSEYIDGVEFFLNYAYTNGKPQGGEILCPCAKCHNTCWEVRAIVYDHLIGYGFEKGYDVWVRHGEVLKDMYLDGLLHDTFRDVAEEYELNKGPNDDAKKFYNLIEEAQQDLYPGCKNFSTLSFTIRLYLLKCLHGWSNASFTSLLGLLREAMPHLNIPDSFYKTICMIRDLGLDYEKIDACPNDCMLYWKDHKNDYFCHVCGASRYTKSSSENDENKNSHKIPAKVLRYFPLIPRLQRLFMCSKTASSLRWHEEECPKDGKLRHPVDGEAWKDFDKRHPEFAIDSRNIRLGLASDGFNPFRSMNLSHNTWPVVLIPYNFPPWWCMKAEYSILSLIIPGPKSPGNDIDVYLQPLVDDLKVLWESGVETYDASKNQTFHMRAALIWTINDFPAYAMLSGWSTKGKLACPCCNYETNSAYLMHSRKMCYMDHRIFLPMDHEYRSNTKAFNGRKEFRPPSHLLEVEEDKYGLICVYFKKICYKNDPFVLASQVKQCFYIQDPLNSDRNYVLKIIPRDYFDMKEESHLNIQESYQNEPPDHALNLSIVDERSGFELVRGDLPPIIVENPLLVPNEIQSEDSDHDDTLWDYIE